MNSTRDDLQRRFTAWLEGGLTAGEEAELFAEAARPDADPALAAEVEGYRRMLAGVRALPEAIEPERDLWPGIARRAHAAPPRRLGAWLALAAALVAAVGAGWLWRGAVLPPSSSGVESGARRSLAPRLATPVLVATGVVGRSAYAETDQALAAIRDELRRSIEARQDKLPPGTRALVFANLRTIDRAIAEIEAALRQRPADPELARTYIAYRKNQIELLRQANRMAARL
ncbi:MAG: hypothetical protein U0X73_17160 [Thermoanaerobaculia bacterium]